MTDHNDNRVGPGDAVPHILRQWLSPFRFWFTAPSWDHLLVLVMGAILSPGKRTVTACLRITGRAEASNFAVYHQLLNRARWNPRTLASRLLSIVVASLVPDGPIVIGMDDTIERRWGPRIAARGIYRDPVRSSHGHFVKASGLRWLSFMILAPVPWAKWDVLQGSDSVRDNPTLGIFHTTRRNSGRPSSVIRLRTWTPILASVF
ncbi:transposase [Neorhizobium galegae]|uniref:transposase n=1 Tax=Neorhizobium galegae TaxID=399 RepID=UPI0020C7E8F0|nr:transposase [Neorhizobium galegae]